MRRVREYLEMIRSELPPPVRRPVVDASLIGQCNKIVLRHRSLFSNAKWRLPPRTRLRGIWGAVWCKTYRAHRFRSQ
jgi:hypothetical protein